MTFSVGDFANEHSKKERTEGSLLQVQEDMASKELMTSEVMGGAWHTHDSSVSSVTQGNSGYNSGT